MNTLRREIHPQIKIIDAAAGVVEYVATDESLDCYNEVVMASGARFDRFQNNAPFVDSHQYDSIDCLLGRVVDCAVNGRRVVETVKWAIDVPSNLLAQKGFAMTQAGYLKAISIGFMPEKVVSRWDGNQDGFEDAMSQLDLGDNLDDNTLAESINRIYTQWQQTELSACLIGANPKAVAMEKAYKDGILDDEDLNRWPSLRRAIESAQTDPHRRYSFAIGKKLPRTLAEFFNQTR
ncbi:MAG TPA: hypothetical protein VH595_22035 [Verrucomicrobiae bacterium]|jgi:hypothetical protein|nr:hypothetical protein [Verrucomicrobiae bacterium]